MHKRKKVPSLLSLLWNFFTPLLSGPKTAFIWGFGGQDGGPKKVLMGKKFLSGSK